MTKYIDCCNKCGEKKYNIIQEAGNITLCKGICPLCKKKKLIVPARDWAFMEGDDSKWD